MNCKKCTKNLTAYLHSELAEAERIELERHIESCQDCHNELVSQRALLGTLQQGWPQVVVSQGFAQNTLRKLHAQDRLEQEQQTRACFRHYPIVKTTLLQRLTRTLQRSPYFVASIALHTAAALIIIALLVRSEPAPIVITTTTIDPVTSFQGMDTQRNFLVSAWLERRNKPSVLIKASMNTEGMTLDIPQFLGDESLTLVDDPELGCVKAYHSGKVAGGLEVAVNNSILTIPESMAMLRFGNELLIRAIDLDDRIEFWAEKHWLGIAEGGRGLAKIGETESSSQRLLFTLFAAPTILPKQRRALQNT